MDIWTDGSANPNPGAGGWGWHRSDGVSRCGGEIETTNNRMEMTAILEALRELPNGQQATVYSDSQYCVKGLTIWRSGWRRKGWTKKNADMPNRDLWLLLEEEMIRCNIDMQWVKGHSGHPENDKADELAERGRQMALKQGKRGGIYA